MVDRFIRFRYKGTVYTTVQHGIDKGAPIVITSGAHCFPNAHLNAEDIAYLRRRGIVDEDWRMTDERVPDRILDEIDSWGSSL